MCGFPPCDLGHSKQTFRQANVPHCEGSRHNLFGVEDTAEAALDLFEQRPHITKMCIKHNDGAAGLGNAVLKVGAPSAP